jgi:hypothetical protein
MIDSARGAAALGHHASPNNNESSLAMIQLAGRCRPSLNSRTESTACSGKHVAGCHVSLESLIYPVSTSYSANVRAGF